MVSAAALRQVLVPLPPPNPPERTATTRYPAFFNEATSKGYTADQPAGSPYAGGSQSGPFILQAAVVAYIPQIPAV